ncbi:MAG: transporter substrate-binding domain-containing protein [Candidatus Lokiarchaeota archaeon]|nr:transporter substrate-binding domain-containing protein [Candidatus Lokiarchaeota archaeon]
MNIEKLKLVNFKFYSKNFNLFYWGISIIMITIMLSCQKTQNSSTYGISKKEQILQEGKIRSAYAIYPPASVKDPNSGEISGIFIDVIEEAAKNLDLKVDWTEEVPWGTMIEGLKNNRYDIIGSGVWANAARARGADFTIPIYYNGVGVYVRANDNRFSEGLKSLHNMDPKNLKIAIIDGEMADLIARTDFPDAELVSLPQLSEGTQLLLEVASGKADLTFVQPFTANEYLAANPGSVKNIDPGRPIRIFPTVFMIKEGEYELKRMLDIAIEELINSGFVDRTIEKYAPKDLSFYRVDYPYRSAER